MYDKPYQMKLPSIPNIIPPTPPPHKFSLPKTLTSSSSSSSSSSLKTLTSSSSSSSSSSSLKTLATQFSLTVNQSSISSWNAQISDLARSGDPSSALLAFSSLRRLRLTPDRSSFPPAISSAADLLSLPSGRQLHLLSLSLGLHSDLFVSSSLVHMYSRCLRPADALNAFRDCPRPNSVLWTAMISGYVYNDAPHIAISTFRDFFAEEGAAEVDCAAAVSALSACARVSEKFAVSGFHDLVVKIGLRELGVWNTLVDAYAKCGELGLGRRVFDEMAERDVVSWNSMIAVYAQGGLSAEALGLYSEMARGGAVRWNAVTLSAGLLACAHAGALQIGKFIHDQVYVD